VHFRQRQKTISCILNGQGFQGNDIRHAARKEESHQGHNKGFHLQEVDDTAQGEAECDPHQ
jgi:hypothetical protein